MFSYFICLLLVIQESQGSSPKNVNDANVLSYVEVLLDECTKIVSEVGDFVPVYGDDENRRRSDKNISSEVRDKLKTCKAIIGAVDSFREEYKPSGFTFATSKGYLSGAINLKFSEIDFLKKLLTEKSKGFGEVLYVASKNGDSSSSFHSACDGKGPTIVLVETTTGAIFGGYADQSWSTSGYITSTGSFLFRLRPVMSQYTVITGKSSNAIYGHSSYGPAFGGGNDFRIYSNSRSSTSSYTNGGHTYSFPSYPSYQLTDGQKNFQVKDYVVLKAE